MGALWERQFHWIDLADWRRQVARSYRDRDESLYAGEDPREVWDGWRQTKDELFRRHPQSPLSDASRLSFRGLSYFPYDPEWRIEAKLEPLLDEPLILGETVSLGLGPRFRKAARLDLRAGDFPFLSSSTGSTYTVAVSFCRFETRAAMTTPTKAGATWSTRRRAATSFTSQEQRIGSSSISTTPTILPASMTTGGPVR